LIEAFLLLGAALFPSCQIVLWLRDGYWTPMPLALTFRWFGVDVVANLSVIQGESMKKICMWVMTFPLAVVLVALAIAQYYALDWLSTAFAGDQSHNLVPPRS
jgi:hypothetical protein